MWCLSYANINFSFGIYVYFMFYSLVICPAMHFYGYEGPEDREWSHPRWYKLEPTIVWIQDHDPNVWEIMD